VLGDLRWGSGSGVEEFHFQDQGLESADAHHLESEEVYLRCADGDLAPGDVGLRHHWGFVEVDEVVDLHYPAADWGQEGVHHHWALVVLESQDVGWEQVDAALHLVAEGDLPDDLRFLPVGRVLQDVEYRDEVPGDILSVLNFREIVLCRCVPQVGVLVSTRLDCLLDHSI